MTELRATPSSRSLASIKNDADIDVTFGSVGNSARANRALLLSAYVLLFSTYAMATMLSAFFTPITQTLGISGTVNGLVFSAYPFGQSLSSVGSPRIVGALGACNSVSLGLLAASFLNVIMAFAPSLVGNEHLEPASAGSTRGFVALSALLYLFTGVSAAVAETAVIMLVGNRFKANAGKVMASITTASGVGCMVGPLIGGVLYDLAPISKPGVAFRIPFLTMALFLLLIAWPLRFTIDHDRLGQGAARVAPAVTAAPDAPPPKGHYARLRTPSIMLGMGAIVLSGAVIGTLDPTLSYRLQAPPFWFSDSALAATFTLSSITYALLSVPVGWACDKDPNNSVRLKVITAVGFGTLSLTFFLLGPFGGLRAGGVSLSGAFNTPELALFAMLMKGVGSALSTSAVYVDLGLGIGEHEDALQATMSSLWNAAYAFGWSLGPLLGGAIYSVADAHELCLSGSLGVAQTCRNSSAPPRSSALVDGERCECAWQPRNGFDGMSSVLTIICMAFVALLLLAAARNVRDYAPRGAHAPGTGLTVATSNNGGDGANVAPTDEQPRIVPAIGQALLPERPGATDTRTQRRAAAVVAKLSLALLICFVALVSWVPSSEAVRARCEATATLETALPGGPSRGLSYCIDEFVRSRRAGEDEYINTIDGAHNPHALAHALGCSIRPVNVSVQWQATIRNVPWPGASLYPSVLPGRNGNYTSMLNSAAWVLPPGYESSEGESRLLFVHGCDIECSALGPYYLGFVAVLANWTRLPVLAFDFASEPVTPWPNNVRSVLYFVQWALHHGPGGSGRAGSIFVLGDSEGTLVTVQTMITLFDDHLRLQSGYGAALRSPSAWLAGVILSSPALDVSCQTASFAYNCFNCTGCDLNAVPPVAAHTGTGDPDTGDCPSAPSIPEQGVLFGKYCRSTYLPYFFGLDGLAASGSTLEASEAFWSAHRDFFDLGNVNPMRAGSAELRNLPPFLLLAGTRDMYYTDSTSFGALMCQHGVDVEVYNAAGAYHDFLEYSLGCGGGHPMKEAVDAYERIVAFIAAKRLV